MEKSHTTASPVLGLSSNGPPGQSVSPFLADESSPASVSCASPSPGGVSGRSCSVPQAKRDGLKLKIRTNKSESRVLNNYDAVGSPNEIKGNNAFLRREQSAIRMEKHGSLPPGEKLQNSTLTRSLSANSKIGKPNPNNVSANIVRRLCSVDSVNPNRENSKPNNRVLTNSKYPDKNSLRHSPRTPVDHINNDTRGKSESDSPFNTYPSPSSSENAVPTSRTKTKNSFGCDPSSGAVSSAGMTLCHHMSRTSSSNSVSDLSPCSGLTDENPTHGPIPSSTKTPLAKEAASTNLSYQSECNTDTITDLNIDSSLLNAFDEESINPRLLDNDDFAFPDNGGTTALSAEDVQQTLNCVSAEPALPGLPVPDTNADSGLSSSHMENRLPTNVHDQHVNRASLSNAAITGANNVELRGDVSLSNTTVSMVSTSSTTSVVTTVMTLPNDTSNTTSKTSTQMIPSNVSNPANENLLSNSTSSVSSTTSFSATISNETTKSQLQEILGVTDTNRLKNMARPVDSAKYQASSSTSFSTKFNKPNKVNPYAQRMSSSAEHGPNLMMSATSPTPPMSGLSPRTCFAQPGNSIPFTRHSLQPVMSNPPRQPHTNVAHGYDMHLGMPLRRSPSIGDHSCMGPRPSMQFDQANMPLPHHMHCPVASPKNAGPGGPVPWQRQGSVSGGVLSPQVSMSVMDGSKSPRGTANFPPERNINPMSGLQNTVDSIPSLSSLMKNNNNNLVPSFPGQDSSGYDNYMSLPSSVESRSMLPPPSPSLLHDKRSMSADGTLGVSTAGRSKGGKRDRGLSMDGDKKDSAPKPKRRKSKSKDESKKAECRANSRSCSTNEAPGPPYFYIFNTDIANKAASMVLEQSVMSIINHHNRFQGNCRLLPSKSASVPLSQSSLSNTPLTSPSFQTAPTSVQVDTKPDIKPFAQGQLSTVTSATNGSTTDKTTNPLKGATANITTTAMQDIKPFDKVKLEPDLSTQEGNVSASPSAPTVTQMNKEDGEKRENAKDDLSDEQLKHRKESLNKLELIKSRFLPDFPNQQNSSHAVSSKSNQKSHYHMSRHLEKVQEQNKAKASSNSSTEEDWFMLVQAYNERRKKDRAQSAHCQNMEAMQMEAMPADPPPPYNPAAPGPINPRWMGPVREPVPPAEMGTPRYPHIVHGPARVSHDVARFPASFPHGRFSRGYRVPGSRVPMYHGPAGVMIPRGSAPQVPHGMPPSQESYPFSEKLKEQASLYQSEGVHGPHGPMNFDLNNPAETPMGPRMGSPDWPHYNHPSVSMAHLNRLPRIPDSMSPTHQNIGGPASMLSTTGQAMDLSMLQGLDPSFQGLESSMSMRVNNPAMNPTYGMTSYPGKPPNNLPRFQDAPGLTSIPPQGMCPSTNNISGMINAPRIVSSQSGMMVDAMARRGEQRPPDLNINSNLPRSSPPFHAHRHPAPSPSVVTNSAMGTSQYLGGDVPGIIPQASPHPNVIPRSPMVNSPSLMKSPMQCNQMPYIGMGQPGSIGPSIEQANMMHGGPPSAGPGTGTPADWSSMSQPSMVVKDTVSPPPLSHMNGGQAIPQEPPPLSHNPSQVEAGCMPVGPGTPGMMIRPPHPCGPSGYDPGPRSAASRQMNSIMGDAFGTDYSRPPSHPGMCMSPGPVQGAVQPAMMEMHGPPAVYMSQSHMVPNTGNPGPGNVMSSHPQGRHPSNPGGIPEFDLTGILPSDKPSQTLSYFPSGVGNPQDNPQIDSVPSGNMQLRSPPPTMPQQVMNRFPNMGQRPMNSPGNIYIANPSTMRVPGPGAFMGPNTPGYSGPGGDGYMSPSWEGMPGGGMGRPQLMMPNSGPNMHPGFQTGRPLM